MPSKKILSIMFCIMLGVLLLTACGGRGGAGNVPGRAAVEQTDEGRANVAVAAPRNGVAAQAQVPAQPAANIVGRQAAGNAPANAPENLPANVGGRDGARAAGEIPKGPRVGGSAPANLPVQPGGEIQLPGGGSAGSYEAQAMISTFAAEYLGVSLTSVRAGGTDADASIPAPAESEMAATVALAGQVAAGVITVEGGMGAAQVAVGEGSISGDLTTDIDAAAAGAFSLLLQSAAAPGSEQEALNLILVTYPKLASAGLVLESSEQGYVFKSVSTEQSVDGQEREAVVVARVIVAGVMAQGPKPLVWAMVANGTFAAALELPF